MDEPPLFSKPVDDMLPPESPGDGKIRGAQPPTAPARAAEPDPQPELRWWQSALGGGIAILLIMFVRLVIRGVADGFGGFDWAEFGGITVLAFLGGCLLGLAFWGFDWLKCRFARGKARGRR